MSVPEKLVDLLGNWSGINRLHLPWITDNPIQESKSNAFLSFSAQEKFLKLEYEWMFENKKQDGLILLSKEKNSDLIKAFWIDSWHLGDKFMISEGLDENIISLKGSYSVPDHPDWGWRTTIESENNNSFKITMFNISPEGKEDLAVELTYQRK